MGCLYGFHDRASKHKQRNRVDPSRLSVRIRGALWGTTVNKQRAEQAERRAAGNERDASNGRALASSQIAAAGDIIDQNGDSALQSMGAGPDRAAAEVIQRNARQARMLFPDL
jgi:hypothetical protein